LKLENYMWMSDVIKDWSLMMNYPMLKRL
jgi:hypothetical protein